MSDKKNQKTAAAGGGGGVPLVPIAPGNFDRAWNDPPLFGFSDASASATTSAGSRLNKRVAYPPSSSSSAAAVTAVTTAVNAAAPPALHDAGARRPPTADSILLPPPPTVTASAVLASDDDPQQASPEVCPGPPDREAVVTTIKDLVAEYCGEGSGDQLLRRLAPMEAGWRAGKFKPRMEALLHDFSFSLQSKNLGLAEKNLVALGADYSGECAQWIVVLRHLLLAVQKFVQERDDGGEAVSTAQPLLLLPVSPPTTL